VVRYSACDKLILLREIFMNVVRVGALSLASAFLLSLAACSTQPISDDAVVRAEADCYVTGSNLKRKGADCMSARKNAGVQDVSAEAIQAVSSKATAGGAGVTGK
jgi:hypothetical protein